jgi:hypothetical protein
MTTIVGTCLGAGETCRFIEVDLLTREANLTIESVDIWSFGSSGDGGAIHASGTGSLVLDGVKVRECTAAGSGGALFFDGNGTGPGVGGRGTNDFGIGGSLTIRDSTFTDNTAGTDGGAVACMYVEYADVSGSAFSENSAVVQGGAIGFNPSTLVEAWGWGVRISSEFKVQDSTFSMNTALDAGAIWVIQTEAVHLSGMSCTAHSAKVGRGGCVEITIVNDFAVSSSTFEDNEAPTGEGGAIGIVYVNNTIIDTSTFRRNRAGMEGGAIYNMGTWSPVYNNMKITDSIMEANNASVQYGGVGGGGVYTRRINDIVIERTTFHANRAKDGAGVWVDGAVEKTSVSDSTFTNNRATATGGGINFEGTKVTSVHGTVVGEHGAALLTLTSNEFSGNQAESADDVAILKWAEASMACCTGLDVNADESVLNGKSGYTDTVWLEFCDCDLACSMITRSPTAAPTSYPSSAPTPPAREKDSELEDDAGMLIGISAALVVAVAALAYTYYRLTAMQKKYELLEQSFNPIHPAGTTAMEVEISPRIAKSLPAPVVPS